MTSETTPRVTVIIPLYNCARYVGGAIQSVLDQTFADFELLVLDNASTDGSPSVVSGFTDRRLVCHRNQENLGFAGNVELGMRMARGEYVAVLGADDLWCATYLERTVAFLDRHPNVSLVHSDAIWIDENSRPFGESAAAWPVVTAGTEAFVDVFRFGFSFATVLMRNASLRRFGGLRREWGFAGDLTLFLHLCLEGDVGFIAESLAWYRHHSQNQSTQMHAGDGGGMLRMEFLSLDVALTSPQSRKLNLPAARRRAVSHITRRIVRMVHLARLDGGFTIWVREFAGVLAAAPVLCFYPSTWARFALGLLPPRIIRALQRIRHSHVQEPLTAPPDAWLPRASGEGLS